MRLKRPDFRPDGPDLKPERQDLRLERPDLRPERPDGGERTNGQTKVPLCSIGLCPLWGRCPKREANSELSRHVLLSLYTL